MGPELRNVDESTVAGFGREWSTFDQADLPLEERARIFNEYFAQFPWALLGPDCIGADVGCGSGRWAQEVAPRVGHLHLIDASSAALNVARANLAAAGNCSFHVASVDDLPFGEAELDFAYSLGVLHHVPDTAGAIRALASRLKKGAPCLIYLYYAFDNRPAWFRTLWHVSNGLRKVLSRAPYPLRLLVSQLLAAVIYWPLARLSRLVERLGGRAELFPLAYYRDKSFYVMRTDSLDRFGTRLEQRFTRAEIREMLHSAGFADVRFADHPPFWCAVAIRA